MISKVISATKLLWCKIVELVCESLDLGAEGVHHAVVVILSDSLNFGYLGENPVDVVGVPRAVVVVSDSLDLGDKGANLLLLLCPSIAAVSNVPTLLAAPPKPTRFSSGTNNFLMLLQGRVS